MWVFFFFDNREFLRNATITLWRNRLFWISQNILLWKLVFRKSSRNGCEFIFCLLTQERATVETESENPTPAYFCTFSSKYKHSTVFIYMVLFSFYLCIFRKFNKIFAQEVLRTCEGPRCQVIQRTGCKRGTGSWMGEKWLGREAQKRREKKCRMTLNLRMRRIRQAGMWKAETVFITFCSYQWCLDYLKSSGKLPVLTYT